MAHVMGLLEEVWVENFATAYSRDILPRRLGYRPEGLQKEWIDHYEGLCESRKSGQTSKAATAWTELVEASGEALWPTSNPLS